MKNAVNLNFNISGNDFKTAGEASGEVKKMLKQLGINQDIIRRFSISMYEAEMNMVIHGGGGEINVFLYPNKLEALFSDNGPGIEDIEKAMTAGYSTATDEIRELGFGAGMGLPNIKKYTDILKIKSKPGVGTKLFIEIDT